MKLLLDSVECITDSCELDMSFGAFGVDDHGVKDKVFVAFFEEGVDDDSDFIDGTDEFIGDFVETDKLRILIVVINDSGIRIDICEFFG